MPFSLQAHVLLLETAVDAASWLDDPESSWRDDGLFHAAVWRAADGGSHIRPLESGKFAMLSHALWPR